MGTRLQEVSKFDKEIIVPNSDEGIRAGGGVQTPISLFGADPNGEIIYTGLIKDVRVCHLGGISKTLLVTVTGNDVLVQLRTDPSGLSLSTANDVITEIRSKPAATRLLTASLPIGSTGKGLVGVYGFVQISAGEIGSVRVPFQKLANRTRYLLDTLTKFLQGEMSLSSLAVDLVGEEDVIPEPGRILSEYFQAQPDAKQHAKFFGNRIAFYNVGNKAADGNPPYDTLLENEIRPITISKSWGRIETDGRGSYNVIEGCNYTVTLFAAYIQITMKKAMLHKDAYCVLPALEYAPGAGAGHGWIQPKNIDASTFFISIYPATGGFANPLTTNIIFNFGVFGRQST